MAGCWSLDFGVWSGKWKRKNRSGCKGVNPARLLLYDPFYAEKRESYWNGLDISKIITVYIMHLCYRKLNNVRGCDSVFNTCVCNKSME